MANVWEGAYDMDDSFNFLSLKGVKQAELAGLEIKDWLGDSEINHVISSNATRAKQTATIMMQAIGGDHWKRDYSSDDRLNEWCFGAPNQTNWWDWESKHHFVSKIDSFYDDYLKSALEKNTNDVFLVVSHYYTMSYLIQKIYRPNMVDASKILLVDKNSKVRINNAQPYYYTTGMEIPLIYDNLSEEYGGGR